MASEKTARISISHRPAGLITIFLLFHFLSGCGHTVAIPDSAKAAVKALKKIEAKTQAGIIFAKYSESVGDTLFEVKEFTQSQDAKIFDNLAKSVSEAMEYYQMASDRWNLAIKSNGKYKAEDELQIIWNNASINIKDAETLLNNGGKEFPVDYLKLKKSRDEENAKVKKAMLAETGLVKSYIEMEQKMKEDFEKTRNK